MDHIDEANSRTRCIFGTPFVILVIAAVVCLIISIVGIVGAIKDTDFDAFREDVPGLEPFDEASLDDVDHSSLNAVDRASLDAALDLA